MLIPTMPVVQGRVDGGQGHEQQWILLANSRPRSIGRRLGRLGGPAQRSSPALETPGEFTSRIFFGKLNRGTPTTPSTARSGSRTRAPARPSPARRRG